MEIEGVFLCDGHELERELNSHHPNRSSAPGRRRTWAHVEASAISAILSVGQWRRSLDGPCQTCGALLIGATPIRAVRDVEWVFAIGAGFFFFQVVLGLRRAPGKLLSQGEPEACAV